MRRPDRELLVPLLDGVVQEIDDEARVVHVELPEGLLD
jgi:ribosomal 30S subunit maturation factor RimM